MTHQALSQGQPCTSLWHLGTLSEDLVIIRHSDKAGEPHIIRINCIDRPNLAYDVAKAIFEFGLDVVQADFLIDGRWCLLLFWVTPKLGSSQSTKLALLKERLTLECPSPASSSFIQLYTKTCIKKNIYLLQTCSVYRLGILNDIAHTLWTLELEVVKVNALTSPDGSAVMVFILQDMRSEPQGKRQADIFKTVLSVLGASHKFCKLSLASLDDINEPFDLESLHDIPDELIPEDLSLRATSADAALMDTKFSFNMDNTISAGHTLLQIAFDNRRGLLYDCLRALNDHNLQVSYGRLTTTPSGRASFDLFVSQANGTKLLQPDKQQSLQARLKMDVCEPIRVMIVNTGMNQELLVATTVEKCGRARPHILNDVTLALKMLQLGIFKANNERICHGDRIWDLYRFVLVSDANSLMRSRLKGYVVDRVKSVLIG